MKELGITKGEWVVKNNNELTWVESSLWHVATISEKPNKKHDESKLNAKLIADAGTTANKCNLLPSELLQRYNEAIEVLEAIKQSCDEGKVELFIGHHTMIKQTISKAKGGESI